MAASDTVEVSREHLENAITELQEVIASDAETSMTDVETVTEDELEWCDEDRPEGQRVVCPDCSGDGGGENV